MTVVEAVKVENRQPFGLKGKTTRLTWPITLSALSGAHHDTPHVIVNPQPSFQPTFFAPRRWSLRAIPLLLTSA